MQVENVNPTFRASQQWASRPGDERYTSLETMLKHFQEIRENSRAVVVPSKRLRLEPEGQDHKGLVLYGPNGHGYAPTHFSFGQIAQLAEAPAGYLRSLPSEIAADCVNYGLQFKREIEDVGVLLYKNGGAPIVRAATGPRYGRIWNAEVLAEMVARFGDGVTGQWRVPGEFGKPVEVTKANTTLYASDRDFFVFLADEEHRIEIPNRRPGEMGTLARGFYVWNSETGDKSFGLGTFLFDYACKNRIVWGMDQYRQITIRHSVSAPDKFLEEIQPALLSYAESSTKSIDETISAARAVKIGEDVNDFLSKRFGFGAKTAAAIETVHMLEEGRPIETLWDATTAVTAYAKSVAHTDRRVDIEKKGGEILELAR